MNRLAMLLLSGLVGAIALLLGGCASSYQARSMEIKHTMLVNPDILKPGTGDQALYRYQNPDAKGKKYTKMLIAPVLLARSAELDAETLENYQKLANNAYIYLVQELQNDFKIVQTPEPETLRLQLAILDAEPSSKARNILSSVVPIGIGISAIQGASTGKQTGVGEITVEFKISDAMTGELLGAAIDRRVGGKDPGGMFDSWYNADAAMKYWAKRTRFVLCTEGGRKDCVKP
ncbi:MAG: DUF3313 domain-containing protein [Deltaproteobacteria bacterium]|nr:DUF3313 domain-containing protein [Deltaproteobacteria bacterium]PWB63251.1 MAG: DUF3313 domain-containing protein [Deltaproteobacteria bacterium]